MLNLPFLIFMTTSKKLTCIFNLSKVNLIRDENHSALSKISLSCSSLYVQIKDTLSMNRFHCHSFIDYALRNSASMKSIKIQPYGGGGKFSTNSGSTCLLEKLEIKFKKYFFDT